MNGMFKDILDSVRDSYKPQFETLFEQAMSTPDSKEKAKCIFAASLAWAFDDFDKAINKLKEYLSQQNNQGA